MLQRIKDFFDERLSPGTATADEDSEHVLRLATGALLLEMVYMDGELRPEQVLMAGPFVVGEMSARTGSTSAGRSHE